jgi:hypothetical protein
VADMFFEIFKVLGGSVLYKDFVRRVANEFSDPLKVERGVRETLGRDLEFTTTLFSLLPRSANAAFAVLGGVNSYISKFSEEAVFGLLKGVAGDFRASYAANVVNNFFDQIERLRKQHPKLVADLAGDKIGEFIDTLDFGKLRKFIEDSAVCTYGTFEVINRKVFGNPVKVGNLVSSIPPVLNAGVAIANEALTRIEMPSEVLANVLFETINRLNLEQFGKTISAVSSIVNKVHEGNYILGRGDRKFKEVAEAAMERLVNSVNMEEIVRAIKAFFDDLNDLSDGLNAALWKNPLNMMVLAPLLPAAVNTVSGLTSKVLSKFNELPPDLSAQIVTSLISEIDTKRLGEILTGIAKLVNAVSESDPKAISNLINSVIAASDKNELEKLLNNLIKSLVEVIASNPQILSAVAIPVIQAFGGILSKR